MYAYVKAEHNHLFYTIHIICTHSVSGVHKNRSVQLLITAVVKVNFDRETIFRRVYKVSGSIFLSKIAWLT